MNVFRLFGKSKKKKKIRLVKGKKLEALKKQGFGSWDELFPELVHVAVDLITDQMERDVEALVGPRYGRIHNGHARWGRQQGSIFVGDEKIGIQRPRVRHEEQGEVEIPTYESFSSAKPMDEQCYKHALRGMSNRNYPEVVRKVAEGFGLDKSSVSRRVIRASQKRFEEIMNRNLADEEWFCVYLDGKEVDGQSILTAVGGTSGGAKHTLGIHQARSENTEAVVAFIEHLLERGLTKKNDAILFITDGSRGLAKALRKVFGQTLFHQRCFKHKDFRLENHLPERYIPECKRRFRAALAMNSEADARRELMTVASWLKTINLSAARSLLDGLDELLTCHRLHVPLQLAKCLRTTNPVESALSLVEEAIRRNKRWRNSAQIQRWVAAGFIEAEKRFRKLDGRQYIPEVLDRMKEILLEKKGRVA